jgi:aspartate kinase
MGIVVQKFGGTSVANSQLILSAARKAIRAHQDGQQVVMVVSAMGKNTDHLIELAHEINENPPTREMDMLLSTGEQVSVALMAMAVDSLGYKAVSLTGGQIGIRTDSSHTKARIKSISTERVKKLLDEGNIVIAAGFQGIDENFDITTLGRGGSDTTAVALAAVLDAESCEIYTDVDGVYTTDPRILPEARIARQVSYDEMLELASLGAGVMHSRSIEFGKKFDVPIHVRSSLADVPGSLIVNEPEVSGAVVSGAAMTKDEARITLRGINNAPATILRIFEPIANRKISVDMIVQSTPGKGGTPLSFTVPRNELAMTLKTIRPVVEELGGEIGECSDQVSKVSVVGLGMAEQYGVAERMFRALAQAGINMQMISTSEIKISVLVDRNESLRALRTVHEEFGLHQVPDNAVTDPFSSLANRRSRVAPVEVIRRLQGVDMEGLTIDDVLLDDQQSRITFTNLPCQPGIALKIFAAFSANQIFVDMIVQNTEEENCAGLSITIPREQFVDALRVAKEAVADMAGTDVVGKERIAKLVVSGIGLRSHTGMAIAMFRALADQGINLEMISTSEVRVNVVIDGSQGQTGLQALRDAFSSTLR